MSDSKVKSTRKSFRRKYRTLSKNPVVKLPDSICRLIFHTNVMLTAPVCTTPCLNLPQMQGVEAISYYHGLISQAEGGEMLENEGDFLIRNCSQDPNVLVLSCLRLSTPFHFNIFLHEVKNKHQEVIERYYHLEKSEEKFQKIAELINHYKYEHKSLSPSQTVLITNPIKCTNRNLMPLTNHNDPSRGCGLKVGQKWTGSQPLLNVPQNLDVEKLGSIPLRYGSMPSIHKRLKASSKHPINQLLANSLTAGVAVAGIACGGGGGSAVGGSRADVNGEGDGDGKSIKDSDRPDINIGDNNHLPYNNSTANTNNDTTTNDDFTEISQNSKDDVVIKSVNITSCTRDNNTKHVPPPKPSRVPTLRINEGQTKRPIVKVRNKHIEEGEEDGGGADSDDKGIQLTSVFNQSHSSKFISNDQPLAIESTNKILDVLLTSSPLQIANCITAQDIQVFRLLAVNHVEVGGVSGMELMVLPDGGVVRGDAIERHYGLRYFVIATILSNQSTNESEDKRHGLLSHWLEVAMQLKLKAGNLFSFFTVMDAICSPQVIRLKMTWLRFKQDHFNIFEAFESDLLPLYKGFLDLSALNDPYKRGTILPHVLPFLLAMEEKEKASLAENALPGLDAVMTQFAAMRLVLSNIKLYRSAVQAFKNNKNEFALMDIFNPNTQEAYLWGGARRDGDGEGRVGKIDQLVTSMSAMVE